MEIRHRENSPLNILAAVLFTCAVLHMFATDTIADPCVWVPRVLGF